MREATLWYLGDYLAVERAVNYVVWVTPPNGQVSISVIERNEETERALGPFIGDYSSLEQQRFIHFIEHYAEANSSIIMVAKIVFILNRKIRELVCSELDFQNEIQRV